MKNLGWIKLYRKTLDNWVWKHDFNAWHVFEWLLMVVDKKTGNYTVGRMQGAKATGMPPSTFRNSLARLEKYEMVRTGKRTGCFTFVHINKFAQYQGITDTFENDLSTSYPQREDRLEDTKQEEHRNTTRDFKNLEVNEVGLKRLEEMKNEFFGNHIVN